MPKIGNQKLSKDTLCGRCNSKRIVSKTWVEKITTDWGTTVLNHSQLVCTNAECQKEFDRALMEEIKKREKAKAKNNLSK